MNRSSLLHIIERLEGFLGKLPDTIRRPVLHELTPLKELFLQQRPPRFVLTGSNRLPLQEIAATLFDWRIEPESRELLMELFRWHSLELGGRGTVSFLDARGADARTMAKIEDELKAHPPDMLLHLADDDSRPLAGGELENLGQFARRPQETHQPKIIGIVVSGGRTRNSNGESSVTATSNARARMHTALQENAAIAPHLVQVVELA